MRTVLAVALITTLTISSAIAQDIAITPNGAMPSAVGTPGQFTGQVVINPLFPATEETRATTGEVTFAPGARTAWHTHPAGQLLITADRHLGKRMGSTGGKERQEMVAGDAV